MNTVRNGHAIERVRLIDDDDLVRSGYRYCVEELDLNPSEVFGPILSADELINGFDPLKDAVICDFNLRVKNYSAINGDELVSQLYRRQFPVVLCTRYDDHLPAAVRRNRKTIPVVLSPADLHPDSLREAFRLCSGEFAGEYSRERKPRRTQVRVEGGERLPDGTLRINLLVPTWSSVTLIEVDLLESAGAVYQRVWSSIQLGEVARFMAEVNIGAESPEDIFVADWAHV